MRTSVVLGAFILAVASPALAGSKPETETGHSTTAPSNDALLQLMCYRVDKQHRGTGMVLSVLRPSGVTTLSYGETATTCGTKMDGATVFQVASLTKIFTSLLLADAAAAQAVHLDDPLASILSEGIVVPSFGGRGITLTDLATHTAGLPLRPVNLAVAADAPNKYAGYTSKQLFEGLRDYQLTRKPGSQFEYSNVGFALLGQSLATRLGAPYADLLRDRITGPLRMLDTTVGLPVDPKCRAQPHDIDLKPVAETSDGALNPAGGLYSTANDLIQLLELFVSAKGPARLPEAARMMLSVDRPGENLTTRMAMGWRRTVSNGETYYWSNGSGDGSRAFMGFNPRRGVAVVALINASGKGVDDFGFHLLDPAQPIDLQVPKIYHQISLPSSELEKFAGIYEYAPGDRFPVSVGATGLLLGEGPAQVVLYPEALNRFFTKTVEAEVHFSPPVDGQSPSFILLQNGQQFTYKRVK